MSVFLSQLSLPPEASPEIFQLRYVEVRKFPSQCLGGSEERNLLLLLFFFSMASSFFSIYSACLRVGFGAVYVRPTGQIRHLQRDPNRERARLRVYVEGGSCMDVRGLADLFSELFRLLLLFLLCMKKGPTCRNIFLLKFCRRLSP